MNKQGLRKAIWDRDRGICQICGKAVTFEDMELDHIVHRSRGGQATFDNLRVTHHRCNRQRGPWDTPPTYSGSEISPYALRIPSHIRKAVERFARDDRRSLNAEIVYLLEQVVVQRRQPPNPP